jgi:GT2 family glycosyltransferase
VSAEPSPADPTAEPVVFQAPAEPVASVIVLAWRLTTELIDCLRALSASKDAPPFEVQLVLNGASPATREIVAARVRGAHIISLDENVGFGGGCNVGALNARGKYLVLLNDDTVVDAAWLATIVAAADAAPKQIGAIASVLFNPDGTVQEAGSRVLPGAGTVQFGKGMPMAEAVAAGLLSRRPIDYGSGAALLIRRSAFEAVGGFDPIYEPAYFEDVDLCFRLRLAGWSTVLEPKAWVMHASGGSTSRDQRFRDFASYRSGKHFIARWAATLAQAPAPDAPLKQLCDPTLAGPAPLPGAPTDIRDPTPSTRTALAIARSYQEWLGQQLDLAQERVIIERHLRGTDVEHIRALTDDVGQLRSRLADLEQRGLFGMMRWRVGLYLRRRRSRREIGDVTPR